MHPEIPLPGIYPPGTLTDGWQMQSATAKVWKQPEGPSGGKRLSR